MIVDKNASAPKIYDVVERQVAFIERLEKERHGKLMTFEDVFNYSKELAEWLISIARYGNVSKTLI